MKVPVLHHGQRVCPRAVAAAATAATKYGGGPPAWKNVRAGGGYIYDITYIPVIYLTYTCHIPIIHIPVIYPSYTCHTPVIHLSYTCHMNLIFFTSGRKKHFSGPDVKNTLPLRSPEAVRPDSPDFRINADPGRVFSYVRSGRVRLGITLRVYDRSVIYLESYIGHI